MNKYRFLISGAVFLILIPLVSAEIIIDIDIKDSFGLGEKVFFNYTITSDNDTEVVIIPYIECPSAPLALMMEKMITLTTNVPYNDIYYGAVVGDVFEPQTCTAYVQVLSPVQMIEQEDFTINTDPSFSFNLNICKDQSCTEESKVFMKNENIYLDYDSDVDNPSVTATLTYPDKKTRTLTLPASIKAEQVGTHTLEVKASKQGYREASTRMQFAVIEQEANFTTFEPEAGEICNENGICEEGENELNCPQDCTKPVAITGDNSVIIYIAVIIIIIFLLIIVRTITKRE